MGPSLPLETVEKVENVWRRSLRYPGKCPNEAVDILLRLLRKQFRRDLKQLLEENNKTLIRLLRQSTQKINHSINRSINQSVNQPVNLNKLTSQS